jgi:hypothetical protein
MAVVSQPASIAIVTMIAVQLQPLLMLCIDLL